MDPDLLLMNVGLAAKLLASIAAVYGLRRLAIKIRHTNTAWFIALACCCGAAYCAGYAVEIVLLQVTGIMEVQAGLLATWILLAVGGFAIAEGTAISGWLAMIPCCFIGGLMMLQGPLTADPLIDFPFGARGFNQYSLMMANVSFGGGVGMIFISVLAALAVGAGRNPAPAEQPATA